MVASFRVPHYFVAVMCPACSTGRHTVFDLMASVPCFRELCLSEELPKDERIWLVRQEALRALPRGDVSAARFDIAERT